MPTSNHTETFTPDARLMALIEQTVRLIQCRLVPEASQQAGEE